MGITYKFLLNTRRDSDDGMYPVILRVYSNRSYKEYALKISVSPKYWDGNTQNVKPGYDNYEEHNLRITTLRNKIKKLILLAELNDTPLTATHVLDNITPAVSKKTNKQSSILKYAYDIISKLTADGKVGNALVYTTAINKFKTFVKKDSFTFEDLNYRKLMDYHSYLVQEGVSVNTISVYMRSLRAIYNRAIKEGIVSASDYPFKSYTIKNERTISRALTTEEMYKIVTLKLDPNTPIYHWRNFFVLSFYMIGINFADLLTLTTKDIIDGRVIYRRSKTGKLYSVKLHPETIALLKLYKPVSDKEYLLPVLNSNVKDKVKLKNDAKQAVKTCNKYLKKIAHMCGVNKPVSTYYARYAFANIARSLGYSKDLIAEALGHEYGNRVTSIYLDDYDKNVIDELTATVTDSVLKCGSVR